jgi:glucokinase
MQQDKRKQTCDDDRMAFFLGIETGGTKLQLGVGAGDGSPLAALRRLDIDPSRGAAGILDDIARVGGELIQQHDIQAIGFGFGGPVDAAAGVVTQSHQITGWNGLPLAAWCREKLGLPTYLGNDCDMAALAEARFGAGRGSRIVFYITVGTGIGGGLVIDGQVHGAGRPAAAEIGHLRPSMDANEPDVEARACGPGLVRAARKVISKAMSHSAVGHGQAAARSGMPVETPPHAPGVSLTGKLAGPRPPLPHNPSVPLDPTNPIEDLLARCGHDLSLLTARHIAQAAAAGNPLAAAIFADGVRALGWAIAQMIALIAPHTVIVGGGVSLAGDALFYKPLREAVGRWVFPPLRDSYRILPPALGEEVVLHGAVAMAAEQSRRIA